MPVPDEYTQDGTDRQTDGPTNTRPMLYFSDRRNVICVLPSGFFQPVIFIDNLFARGTTEKMCDCVISYVPSAKL